MLRFVVRRLLLLIPILFGLSILVFFWVRALPGSPAEGLLGERATPELIAAYRERYGLDEPVYKQYWSQLQSWAHADFGTSVASHREVTDEIKERFPATVELAIAAMLFAVTLGIPLGFFAAKNYGGPLDHASLFISLIGISIPVFFLGILLKYVFSVRLGWLPGAGRIDVTLIPEHPTNFYVLDAIITRDWVALKSCIRAPDPAGDRARLDPARDHRSHHARLRARRPERGLRADCARQGPLAADRRPQARAA